MSSEFYRRTKDLFEEFQKKELSYMNTERTSNFLFTNGSSLPVQEYLQKLDKKEKEAEDTYNGLMRHIEQLDRRTESITEKLQKLDSLRMSMVSKPPMLTHSNTRTFSNYSILSDALQVASTYNDVVIPTIQPVSSETKNVQYSSTQTDLMFCENCHFPISAASANLQEDSNLNTDLPPSFKSSLDSLLFESLSVPRKPTNESNLNLNRHLNIEELPLLAGDTSRESIEKLSILTKDSNKEERLNNRHVFIENINKGDSFDKEPFQKAPSIQIQKKAAFYEDQNTSVQIAKLDSVDDNEFETFATGANLTTNMQFVTNQPLTKPADENLKRDSNFTPKDNSNLTTNMQFATNQPLTKPADENLKHDSNFTPRDNTNMPLANVAQDTFPTKCNTSGSETSKTGLDQDPGTLAANQKQSDPVPESNFLDSNVELAAPKKHLEVSIPGYEDKLSESSLSMGEAHSPSVQSDNVSFVSDSDSYDGKDQLKASAAYQALLGNASSAKNTQKTTAYSESEYEDEIERALSKTTKKVNSGPATSIIQEEKPEESKKNVTEPKPKNEPRKSISLTKSQQLSKSTRKVLGLDTSSGSEGEIKISSNANKQIEEESDEFDFYN